MEASAKSILHDYSGLVYDSETALPMASVAVSNGRILGAVPKTFIRADMF